MTLPVYVHTHHGIWFISLNSPSTRNALGPDVVDALQQAMTEATQDPQLRALVLRGGGGFFSAGGNIGNFKSRLQNDGTADSVQQKNRLFGRFLEQLTQFPAPVVSVVEGAAIGGGMGLACASDVVISTTQARFALTETTLGIVPAQILPFVVRRLGLVAAKRLGLSGQRITGTEAQAIGLVDVAVDAADLNEQVATMLSAILRCGPLANKELKALCEEVEQMSLADFLDHAAARFAVCMHQEGAEGIAAFKEKRAPSWAQPISAAEVAAALPLGENTND